MAETAMVERFAREAMIARGEQWTSMRAKLFGLMVVLDRPVSAYDAAEQLSASEGRRVAVTTVYRMLAIFVARRIISRVESINAYVVNPRPGRDDDGLFLICDGCGRVEHAANEAFHCTINAAARSAGFVAGRLIAEVRGFCSNCVHQNSSRFAPAP